MKTILLFATFMGLTMDLFAQKQSFDIVTYAIPNGWTEQKTAGNVSYSRIDGKSWAQIAIYKGTESTGSIDNDFDKEWNELVAKDKDISAVEKTKPRTVENWNIVSGSGKWQYNGTQLTTILTTYSNGNTCFSILCNATAEPYFKDYLALIRSLELANSSSTPLQDSTTTISHNSDTLTGNITQQTEKIETGQNSIAGLWVVNQGETRGFVNGHLMNTGGYIRKEYQLSKDGTYSFRVKTWLASNETIYFTFETGIWTVSGNQLTIIPKKGKGGWWNKDKATNNVDKWGSFQKAADYKLQKVTYRFEIKEDSNYGNSMIIYSDKPTERDGGQFNNPPYRFSYTNRQSGKAFIDNPPDWKF